MGYFPRKAMAVRERLENLPDRSYPSKALSLQFLLDHLVGKLEELNGTRPLDVFDPMYDQYFSESGSVCAYDEPDTVQGLLKAIEITKEMIRREENRHRGYLMYLSLLESDDLDEVGKGCRCHRLDAVI